MTLDEAFTQIPALITERLVLRQIRPSDAEAFFAAYSDEEVMRYQGHEAHQSIDETHAMIQLTQERFDTHEAIRWGITLIGDDTLLGSCGLHHFDAKHSHAEIGYELKRSHWGQGIMAEAVAAMLTYGFVELGLHRIEAIIDDANTRSKGLLLKLGFTYEGNLRQRYAIRGIFEDEYYYSLLQDEWRVSTQN